jgi:hypothetical protein
MSIMHFITTCKEKPKKIRVHEPAPISPPQTAHMLINLMGPEDGIIVLLCLWILSIV